MNQIVLTSDREEDLELLLHLADRLNVSHSASLPKSDLSDDEYLKIEQAILTFPSADTSSFGDASDWQRQVREDRLFSQ